MSATMKGKLWFQIRESTALFSRTTTGVNATGLQVPTYANLAQKAFFQCRPRISSGFTYNIPRNAITRRFASSGILLFGFNPTTTTTSTLTSYAAVVEKTLCSPRAFDRRQSLSMAKAVWRRRIHSSSGIREKQKTPLSMNKYESTNASAGHPVDGVKQSVQNKNPSEVDKIPQEPIAPDSSSYFHLPTMPKLPHRPSKEELLSAATGFWSRLRVRFKWFSIRSVRPWNVDDWSAFVSWIVLGHIVWILVGTTTFFSLLILGINTVVAQETLARWVGDYLTHSAGIKVVFESAIVPKWASGVITFRNVFVSRRPGQGKSKVSKGSSMSAAAAAAAERQHETAEGLEEEDTNYTQFDVTIDTVNVTLSFVKWWNGKGLLRDVEVKGVRGVVDRTSVNWGTEYVDPRTYKHEHNPGDFEMDSFKLEDLLLTIHQPNQFRPFSVSIFSCELPQLRKQWLFYDILSANQMSGSFDGSLFNIHPHQTHSLAGSHHDSADSLGQASAWKKRSRIRIDGLKIDHLNRGVDGPFGWIYEGNVDIISDIMFPADNDESIVKVMSDFYDRMEATVTSNRYMQVLENNPRTADLNTPEQRAAFAKKRAREDDKRFVVMDLKVHLNDVRAAVPLFTHDLSYTNQALIRPIVAYINSKKTFIPLNCRIVKRASEFDGSWTIFDSGLMEDLSAETYEAFAKNVVDSQARMRRLKKVGFWSISLMLHGLFAGLAGGIA